MTTETPQPPCPHSLPQSGWTTEGPWCAALQMQKKDFLVLLKTFGVPHIPFGRSVLIDVSRFYQHMSKWLDEQGTKRVESRTQPEPQPVTHASSKTGATLTTLTKKQVAEILQCSMRQVELLAQKGRLPSPVYLGDSSPRWKRSEIEAIFDQGQLTERSRDTSPPPT
jgi:predicted DNA-binding transcriptional regulator AlpA